MLIQKKTRSSSSIWKRIFSCNLFLLLSLQLVACGNLPNNAEAGTATASTQQVQIPTPTPTEESVQATVQAIMQNMTLDQKLGQLILAEYQGNDYQNSGLQTMVNELGIGGVIYQQVNGNFNAPVDTPEAMKLFTQRYMQDARIPLLVTTDQEGGLVNRLKPYYGPQPSAQEMGATGSVEKVTQYGKQFAQLLQSIGANGDLAPVADVHTRDPAILSTRMFGRTPQDVALYAGAFLNGLQSNNVIGCLKHFPGLGSITEDPHEALPVINKSRQELDQIDLKPFRVLIQEQHPGMIMTTDVVNTALDPDLPAELSPKVVDGVLRKELGYDGVVVTDGLYMQGISARWDIAEAAVMAIQAGNDLVEGPYTVAQIQSVISAFKEAIDSGHLTMQRVDQSVKRILLLKAQYHIIKVQ